MRLSEQKSVRRIALRLLAVALVVLLGVSLFSSLACGFVLVSTSAPDSHAAPAKTTLASIFAAHADEAAAHGVVCHCLHCPGGKLCCCKAAHSAGEGLILRAACDRETVTLASVAMVKTVPPAPCCLPHALLEKAPLDAPAAGSVDLPSRAAHPLFLPPRLS